MAVLRHRMARAGCLLALTAVSPLPGAATPLCRWVDNNGRTQLAQTVPERYKAVATCTDSTRYDIPAAQLRAARQRADDERQRAARVARVAAPPLAASSPASAPAGAPAASAASAPVPKRPAQAVTELTDCATSWRLYDESLACFGPFQTVHGAIKAEAYNVCNVVVSPEPRCGRRRE
jgi:hypothetical protein